MKKDIYFVYATIFASQFFGGVFAQTGRNLGSYKATDIYVSKSEAKTAMVSNCTDRINYCGNSGAAYVEMGGPGNAITGIYQTFPGYEGSVIGVQFDAAKSPTAATNPVVTIRVYDMNVSPLTTTPLSAGVVFTLTSTTPQSYNITFPVPAAITQPANGFAIGITNSGGSSSRPRFWFSPANPNAQYNYSWVTDVAGGSYPNNTTAYYTTNGAIDALIRPTVSTSVNPAWAVSKTSMGCAFPTVYDFNDNSPTPSSYVNYTMICPGGITSTVNFGDASNPMSPFYGASHTYSTTGNYIASFTMKYTGWTTNCVQTLTSAVLIENPLAAFTYTVNHSNLTVDFTNTSSGMTNYSWDFGDATTSTQQSPGIHTYSAGGAYTVALTGTANCGQPYYSTIIHVADVGVRENGASKMQISLYPNPAADRLTIDHGPSATNIALYNATGSLIKSYNVTGSKTDIDVSTLPKGIYFIYSRADFYTDRRSFIKE